MHVLCTREENTLINEAEARETSEKKRKFELSRIDTGILFYGTAREMKQYAAMNANMDLLDSSSTVTVVRKASVLSDVRQVVNELLVFGNLDGIKVECILETWEISSM